MKTKHFLNPESIFPGVEKLSGFRKVSRSREKYFRDSEKLPDAGKNTFGIPENFPTQGKILSGFRKFFPTRGKILSGFRKGFRKEECEETNTRKV
ncbi:MAG: hypothetical protein LBH04_00515 [Tannerellaceae bacterium]|nr:hypothetical protein [Tannerellaceae bacterium]